MRSRFSAWILSWVSSRTPSLGTQANPAHRPAHPVNGRTREVPELQRALPRIAAEFERARRYERTVTVAVFAVAAAGGGAAPPDGGNGSGAGASLADDHSALSPHLCSVVRQAVREIDVVVCDPAARRCVVVMPEIGVEEGRRAVGRMRQLCAARLECPVRGDLAVFPRDGWVFPDLVEAAEKQAVAAGDRRLIPAMDRTVSL